MDRDEARQVARDELENEVRKGYDELRTAAPYPAAEHKILGFIRRTRWEVPKEHYVTHTKVGPSGVTYYVERSVDWDSNYGGTLRVWVYVHDGEPESATRPEYDCDLVSR